MKTTSTLLSICALGLLMSSLAQAKAKPHMYPECTRPVQQINFPAGSEADLIYSKDCKKAFVTLMSSVTAKITKVKLDPSINEQTCNKIDNLIQKQSEVQAEIWKLRYEQNKLRDEMIAKLKAGERSALVQYSAEIAILGNEIKTKKNNLLAIQLKQPYSETKGVVVTYKLSHDNSAMIKQYKTLNKGNPLKYKSAPIQNGIYSFGLISDMPGILLEGILGMAIPGVTPEGSYTEQRHFKSNKDLTVDFIYSQYWACSEMKERGLLTKENISAGEFVTNYYYEVPLADAAPARRTTGVRFE